MVDYSGGEWKSPRNEKRWAHTWAPHAPHASKALVFIAHGYGAHGAFPSVKLVAERLVRQRLLLETTAGLTVHALDAEGHGRSDGTHGLITDWRRIVQDITDYVQHLRDSDKAAKVFVLGSSMGGALAFSAAHLRPGLADGVVLLAPMLKIKPEAKPPSWQIPILQLLSLLAPSLAVRSPPLAPPLVDLIHESANHWSPDNSKQYRDPEMVTEVERDELAYKGKMRLGTAAALLDLAQFTEENLCNFQVPFLVMHGTADVVVDMEGSTALEQASPSKDKTLRLWDGALHTIVCELPETRQAVLAEVVGWLLKRATTAAAAK